jgi:hypothetical protein
LSSKPDPDPNPELNPKLDPDPKIIISDPQHWEGLCNYDYLVDSDIVFFLSGE